MATTGAWLGAAQRLVEDNSGTELERLSLLINMYDQLEDERFLPMVHAAIRALEAAGIDGTEAGKCTEVLEQVVLTLLPITVQDDARQVLSLVTTKMLTGYGDALTLEEIRSVATSLFECGGASVNPGLMPDRSHLAPSITRHKTDLRSGRRYQVRHRRSMDPEIPRRGDNGLRAGPLIFRQLRQNFETLFPCRPLLVVVLVELQTIGHGRINYGTNPVLSERRPVFRENLSHETQDPPSNLSDF
jgi:hypothetical protein